MQKISLILYTELVSQEYNAFKFRIMQYTHTQVFCNIHTHVLCNIEIISQL